MAARPQGMPRLRRISIEPSGGARLCEAYADTASDFEAPASEEDAPTMCARAGGGRTTLCGQCGACPHADWINATVGAGPVLRGPPISPAPSLVIPPSSPIGRRCRETTLLALDRDHRKCWACYSFAQRTCRACVLSVRGRDAGDADRRRCATAADHLPGGGPSIEVSSRSFLSEHHAGAVGGPATD